MTAREAAIAGQLGNVRARRLSPQQIRAAEDTRMVDTSYTLLDPQRERSNRSRLYELGFEAGASLKSLEDETQYHAGRLISIQQKRSRQGAVAGRQADEIQQAAARLRRDLKIAQDTMQDLRQQVSICGSLTDRTLLSQGLKPGDCIGQIDSQHAYRLDADFNEFYLGRIAEGKHVAATFDGAPVTLTVSRVSHK